MSRKFKPGDRIVKVKCRSAAMIRVGMEVVVIEHPEGRNFDTVSVRHIPELAHESWLTTDFDFYVLKEIYDSPLYKALKEEE